MSDYLKSLPLYVLPHHFISRIIYFLTRIPSRYIYLAINWFVKAFKVNLSEAKISDSRQFATFNEFFTRELQDGARPIDEETDTIVSPVDAHVSQIGDIKDGQIFQAKKHNYSLQQLVANNICQTKTFKNGKFATLYLSPRDYHRIHMPIDGKLKSMTYVPGRLFSVAQHTVRVVPSLFARNERVIAHFDTEFGQMIMILVGAINVAAIETVWAGLITPPNGKEVISWEYAENEVSLKKGQEMGRFNMGSTVILLMENQIEWDPSYGEGTEVILGKKLAVRA